MTRHPGIAPLAIALFILCSDVVRADPPDIANGNANKMWVFRRNESEHNKIGAICTYVHLDDASVGDVKKVSGTLTIWTTRSGGSYATKKTWDLPAVEVQHAGTNTRKREYCRWDASTLTPVPTMGNTDQIKVYASLAKGTNKGHGHEHRRTVLRCFPVSRAGKDNTPPVYTTNCEEEPDDDVLQEETNPDPMPPYDDP